ncbi:MAG: DUF779 domain-containing protein [Pseudomonadota bacterium]
MADTETPITCVTDDGPIAGIDPNERVAATEGALTLLEEIKTRHGEVMFHQSGGCCDGSSPMCYPKGEFPLGSTDVLMGKIGDTEFYISGPQYEAWKHTQVILDVVPGRGGMFSLDNGTERRFLVRSRLLPQDE